MVYLVFIYNALLIALFGMLTGGYIVLFLRDKKQLYIWVALVFAGFIAENMILYMTDFIESFAQFYNLHTVTEPILKTIISAVIVLCYYKIAFLHTGREIEPFDWVAYGIYLVALLLIPRVPTIPPTYFLYFTFSQLIFFYLAYRVRGGPVGETDEKNMVRYKKFLTIMVVLNVAIVVEDAIVIFFFDNLSPEALRITQRNLSEDIQSIVMAAYALVAFFTIIQRRPERAVTVAEDLAQYEKMTTVIRLRKRDAFVAAYHLTDREGELLDMMLAGKSNQEIGDALFISVGTVKNHLHNIYQKTGVSGRNPIMRLVEEMAVKDGDEAEAFFVENIEKH